MKSLYLYTELLPQRKEYMFCCCSLQIFPFGLGDSLPGPVLGPVLEPAEAVEPGALCTALMSSIAVIAQLQWKCTSMSFSS